MTHECAICGGELLRCDRCEHVGCNDMGTLPARPRPCPNRIDTGEGRTATRHCGMCGGIDLRPFLF